MLEQVFVSDELTYLKKERELFREYEGEFCRASTNSTGNRTNHERENVLLISLTSLQ